MRADAADVETVGTQTAAFSEEQLYARQYLAKALREAQAVKPRSIELIDIRPSLVVIACATTYFQTAFASSIFAVGLGQPLVLEQSLPGLVCGLLGALLLRRVELWRRECKDGRPELLDEPTWELACNTKDDELLEKGVLLGVTSISLPARALKDVSFGERSVSIVNEKCTDFEKAVLQITGSYASCSLVHGVVQTALVARLSSLVNWLTISTMPEDPATTWWWPAVASLPALVPVFAVLVTAAFEFSAYLLTCELLLPMSNYEAKACQEAVSSERQRCKRLFLLMGVPSKTANLRSEAFGMLAEQWEGRQREGRQRREITNLVRVLTAAAVYAASGGSILAPVLTNVVVTDSVLGLFTGKSWPF